ncbi:MAG: FimB/Mfa2 family fimbrial subunit [Muribaculaceae bacterium]|nr:FimB/Mfa2 family fimbrial subunit [Muribaculaceae bacterium]
MNLSRFKLQRGLQISAAAIAIVALGSCNSFMHDELPACNPDYRVRLSYQYNMSRTELVNQVEEAEVYAFDTEGRLISFVPPVDKATLQNNDYTISLKGLGLERLKDYHLVVWGGLTTESPFKLDGSRAFGSSGDITCRLTVDIDEEGNLYNDKKFPGLFHGTKVVNYSEYENPEEYTCELMKNTNVLDVTLRRTDNFTIGSKEFIVKVTDNNGVMSSENEVSGDETIHYLNQEAEPGEYALPDGQGGYKDETTNGAKTEVHLARIMENSEARLIVISKEDGTEILNAKLIDLIVAAKNYTHPDMDLQEYLDRMDRFTVDITMDIDTYFMNLSIYVAGWAVMNYEVEWK